MTPRTCSNCAHFVLVRWDGGFESLECDIGAEEECEDGDLECFEWKPKATRED